jgi:hypothetical protein
LKTDERKKALELSRNWLKEEVKNSCSPQLDVSKKISPYRNRLALIFVVAALVVGVIIIVLINNLFPPNPDKQNIPVNQRPIESRETTPDSLLAASTQSQPAVPNLSGENHPAQNSNEKASRPSKLYPSGWPEELHFPVQFILQDANTVRTHDNVLPAYAVQVGFDGEMTTAVESIASYFEKKGWQIVGRSELDSGAIKIDVARNGERDSGHITIDPDPLNTGKVRIVAIIFF